MNDFRSCNFCGEKEKIKLIFSKNHYLIVQCQSCRLEYVNSIPADEELEKIYSEDFFNKGSKFVGGDNNSTLLNVVKRLNRILLIPDVGLNRWLDIGSATGEFIYLGNKQIKEMIGVEFSKFATEQAKILYGISLMNVDFIDSELEKDYFDVVTAWDFIEHVKDPLATFRKIHFHLKPGGCLILSTGDVSSFSSKISGKFWHLMIPPKHLYFFSRITIKKYLEKVGFEQINITYPKKYVPLDFIIWKFFYQINQRLGNWVLSRIRPLKFGKVALSINLYDIMEIYAHKPQTAKNNDG